MVLKGQIHGRFTTDEIRDALKVITGWDSDSEERAKYFNE